MCLVSLFLFRKGATQSPIHPAAAVPCEADAWWISSLLVQQLLHMLFFMPAWKFCVKKKRRHCLWFLKSRRSPTVAKHKHSERTVLLSPEIACWTAPGTRDVTLFFHSDWSGRILQMHTVLDMEAKAAFTSVIMLPWRPQYDIRAQVIFCKKVLRLVTSYNSFRWNKILWHANNHNLIVCCYRRVTQKTC